MTLQSLTDALWLPASFAASVSLGFFDLTTSLLPPPSPILLPALLLPAFLSHLFSPSLLFSTSFFPSPLLPLPPPPSLLLCPLSLPPFSRHPSPPSLPSLGRSSVPSTQPQDAQPPKPTSTATTSPYHDPKKKQQSVRTFLAQKVFRTRQGTNLRKLLLWVLTILSLLLSWVIGYFQQSFAVVLLLLVAMAIFWRDQSSKLARAVEQETELRLRRKKMVQQSETAEWVNLAIKRW